MKIRDVNQAAAAANSNLAGEGKILSTDSSRAFLRELTTLSSENHEKYIASLIDEITLKGEQISKKADIAQIQKYRELITELIRENASNAFSFEKNTKFGARGRNKSYAMIRTVNSKLDELTAEVLKEQSDNINIVNLVDDIRGILVDLFL